MQAKSTITAVDWRTVAAHEMKTLYEAEEARWSSTLLWSTSTDWVELERGRLLGTVDGIVVRDDAGRIAGWTYYLRHAGMLQIGAIVADTAVAAECIVQHVFSAENTAGAIGVTLFVFNHAPMLESLLESRRLAVERYRYLVRPLERLRLPAAPDLRRWQSSELHAVANLFSRAYDPDCAARPFAPRGSRDEWVEYTAQLVHGSGCGRLLPEACVCLDDGLAEMRALALVTKVADHTAHLAQLAVEPGTRGQGLGRRLLEYACAASELAGCSHVTLLVSDRNDAALGLYRKCGFHAVATFVAAGRFNRAGRPA